MRLRERGQGVRKEERGQQGEQSSVKQRKTPIQRVGASPLPRVKIPPAVQGSQGPR